MTWTYSRCCVGSAQTAFKSRFYQVAAGSSTPKCTTWKTKSKPEQLKGGQSACKPLHISPRVHLSKGPPVPPSASQVSSHRCSSWQRIRKERVVEGVDFRYILQGTMGRGPEGKREDVSWFHGTLSVVIYVPSKTNVQTKQPKTPSVSKVAAEPRCSRPLTYEIHLDRTIQTLQFTRQVSTSESNMQSSLPCAPFPSAGYRKEGSPLFVLINAASCLRETEKSPCESKGTQVRQWHNQSICRQTLSPVSITNISKIAREGREFKNNTIMLGSYWDISSRGRRVPSKQRLSY